VPWEAFAPRRSTLTAAGRAFRTPEGCCQLPSERHGISRTQVCTRPVPPTFKQQRSITHVRHQHRVRHGRAGTDTAPGTGGGLLTVAITATEPIKALTGLIAPVLHVFVAASRLTNALGRHPEPGSTGPVEAGRRPVQGTTPARRSARPWGQGEDANSERSCRTEIWLPRTISSGRPPYRQESMLLDRIICLCYKQMVPLSSSLG
jgi:hypothetical protein